MHPLKARRSEPLPDMGNAVGALVFLAKFYTVPSVPTVSYVTTVTTVTKVTTLTNVYLSYYNNCWF